MTNPQELMPVDHNHPEIPAYTETDGPIHFSIGENGALYLTFTLNKDQVNVTAHSANEYQGSGYVPQGALQFIRQHKLRVLEVGAGMNEFITHVSKPMIVDPLPYWTVYHLLERGHRHAPNRNSQKAIDILRKRIEFVTNPNKVYLVNTTFEDAYESHANELRNWGPDIIVDVNGPSLYGDSVKVGEYEADLLWDKNPNRIWSAGQRITGQFRGVKVENLGLTIRK